MKKLLGILFFLSIFIYAEAEPTKQISCDSILRRVIVWIRDFEEENNKYPSSLDDLVKNVPGKRDYDPNNLFVMYQKMGYNFNYFVFENYFEIEVQFDNQRLLYSSKTNFFYLYVNGILENEYLGTIKIEHLDSIIFIEIN